VGSEPDAVTGRGTVAVAVLSHTRPAQVARLVSRLECGTNTMVAVHHDPRGEPLRLRPSSSVALVPDPVSCPWGRLGIVAAIRRSLEWLRANVPTLSWALVVSGQDYPIRTMASIEAELAAARCDAFLRHFRLDGDPADDVHPWQTTVRRRYLYRRRLPATARSLSLPWPRRNPFSGNVGLYAGDIWVNLSARAVDKVLDSPLNAPMLQYLRRSPNPDEAWAVSVALNGDPELAVVNDRRRYIRWPPRSRHPAALGPADLTDLRASSAFFARKVDLTVWPDAYDALDAEAASRD
jgi:Core-2/I-Branching enzyme